MTRRRPDRDELALWRQVAESAKPLHPDRKRKPLFAEEPTPRKMHTAPEKKALAPFRVGQSARPGDASREALTQTRSSPRMDKKAFDRMRRGKLKPQATLDLHGMTLNRAHDATTGFIMRAFSSDLRLVLVVTGKGKRAGRHDIIPERQGILRHHLPQWLSVPPLAQVVLEVSEAHGRHGGGGAFYVYLRRRR